MLSGCLFHPEAVPVRHLQLITAECPSKSSAVTGITYPDNRRKDDIMNSQNQKATAFFTRTPVVFLCAFICCGLWGSAYPCIKIGYQLFGISSDSASSQILFAGFRFTLAGILTLIFGSLLTRRILYPTRRALPAILTLSALQTVIQYVFFYMGLAHTSGVKSSLINALSTFIAIFISAFIFHFEKITWRKLLGCLIGFAGVVIINLTGSGMALDMSLNGEGFLLFSVISYALSSACIKLFSRQYDPVMLSGTQFMIGGLILILMGFVFGGQLGTITPEGILLLIYMAFISAAAYSLWGILLKYNPVSRITVFGFMNPVFGVLLSALLLGEADQAFNPKSLLSLILVCIGILVVNLSPKKERS